MSIVVKSAGTVVFVSGSLALLRPRLREIVARRMPRVFRRQAAVTKPVLIVNRWSGDGKAEQFGLVDAATAAGIEVVMLEDGDDITELARRAIAAGADAIGAAGGDGSLGLVAGVAIEHRVPFFCVPVGTRNHFALDLGLDRDNPLQALQAIQSGEEVLIDYGTANGRVFLNNVCFGIYAEAVHRKDYRGNKERTLMAVAKSFLENGISTPMDLVTPEGEHAERTFTTLVSNNPYVFSGPPDFGRRRRLDAGVLGVAVAGEGTSADGEQGAGLRTWDAPRLVLRSNEPLKAGLDGEALQFDSPVEITAHRRGLRVLVPRGTTPGYRTIGDQLALGLFELSNLGGIPFVTDDTE